MSTTIKNYITGALLFLLIAFIQYTVRTRSQLRASWGNQRTLALRASNFEALHDTTHNLARKSPRVARLMGDSLHSYGKRVVQSRQPKDGLDSALDSQHAGRYTMRVAVDSLDANAVSITSSSTDIDSTLFHLRSEPFTVAAVVSRRQLSDSTSLDMKIVLDSIPLTARIQCSASGEVGVRTASIAVTAPPWANVRFGNVQQEPGICSTPPQHTTSRTRSLFSWSPIALSIGRQLGAGNTGWTAQIGTALVIGAR
ncbi:MAG: hypothetical protein V4550_08970 [Gemmatimonadota bacterium]